MEIFKPIKGFEGLYEISNFGNIKSLPREWLSRGGFKHRTPERLLGFTNDKEGYIIGNLSRNNKSKKVRVHRLVAQHFICNSENKYEVNHIDGNKENNYSSNLEWATRLENQRHAMNNNLIKNKGANHTYSKTVIDLNTGVFYDTIKQAAIAKDIHYGSLKCAIYKHGVHKGLMVA